MKFKRKQTIPVVIISGILIIAQAYADVPDAYQNSGSNNISYDLPSKFYAGINLDYSVFSDNTVIVSGRSANIDSNAMDFGLFGGYKFNKYFSVEANYQRLGKLKDNGGSSTLPLSYSATISNLSFDGIVSYPVMSGYQYTASLYGKAGYGFNFTSYKYNANNGADSRSGSVNKGAYNFGLGLNVDLRSNVSARVGYTYYQAHYPLPGNGSGHSANVFTLGLYYNFS